MKPSSTRRKAVETEPKPNRRVALLEAAVIGIQEQVNKLTFELATAKAALAGVEHAYQEVKAALADAQRNERYRERAHRIDESLSAQGII